LTYLTTTSIITAMNANKFFKKSAIIFLCIIQAISFSAFAKDTTDYVQVAESATAGELESILRKTAGLENQTFGTNNETMLMIALKNDRDADIITLLIKAGSKLEAKAKDKRTPIMFCARFTTKPDVLELIATSGTITSSGKRKRILAKDKAGKTAFDYARKNPLADEMIAVLSKYAQDPGDATVKTDDTSSDKPATAETKPVAKGSDGNSMHTVVATFSNTTKAPEETPASADTTTAAAPAATTAAAPAATAVAEAPAATAPTATVAPAVAATTTPAAATTAVAATPTPNPSSAQAATPAAVQPYNKSYLYDYMNDTSATAPAEEATSTKATITDVNQADKNGVTLLMQAAKAGNDWAVQHLLNNGADVQSRDKDGWSALMYAVRYQNSINIVNMLIEKGAHTRVRNKYNATPLLLAATYSQNPQILSLMLRNRSATEDEVFKSFILALTSTDGSDYIKSTKIQLFLDMGVSVNRVWKGKTPLMYAAQYSNSTAVISLLLQSGAKPGLQNVEGKTAFDFAKQNVSLAHDDVFWSLNSVSK